MSKPSKLTPRSLGCFDEVAEVIGEDAAERELQRVIDCGLVGAKHDESSDSSLVYCFTWADTPQSEKFWIDVNGGRVPQQPQTTHWDGTTWPIPAGQTCIIQGSSSGTPCRAIVDYMDTTHCIWHWEGDDSTIHNNVKYMTFKPVKSERDEMIERIEAYFPQKAGMLSYEEVADFILDVIGDKK